MAAAPESVGEGTKVGATPPLPPMTMAASASDASSGSKDTSRVRCVEASCTLGGVPTRGTLTRFSDRRLATITQLSDPGTFIESKRAVSASLGAQPSARKTSACDGGGDERYDTLTLFGRRMSRGCAFLRSNSLGALTTLLAVTQTAHSWRVTRKEG